MAISEEKKKKLYKQAMLAYAMKLRFEKVLKKKVGGLFNQIVKEFRQHVATHGAASNAYDYQKELEDILKHHHIKVGSDFSNSLRNVIGEPDNNKVIQRKIEANIKGVAAQRAHLISHSITDTTRENMEAAIKQAHIDGALADIELSNGNISKIAADHLNRKLTGREMTIAITETQAASEEGKEVEYTTMIDMDATYDGEPLQEKKGQKMWVAILDDHTREWHAEADGQVVDIDEPFEVGGEELMIPGDDSLGASDENLINCRCSHEVSFD